MVTDNRSATTGAFAKKSYPTSSNTDNYTNVFTEIVVIFGLRFIELLC